MGHGVEQDYSRARIWMRKTAEQGVADAQFLMGVMLAEGLGGDVDHGGANHWLGMARSQGHKGALEYQNIN